jgi:hypothetical protein
MAVAWQAGKTVTEDERRQAQLKSIASAGASPQSAQPDRDTVAGAASGSAMCMQFHRAESGWKGFVNDFLDGLSG